MALRRLLKTWLLTFPSINISLINNHTTAKPAANAYFQALMLNFLCLLLL